MNNILSIDLESWLHFYENNSIEMNPELEIDYRRRLDDNYIPKATIFILDLLDKYKQKATFFVLGELFEWYPFIIEAIKKRGHEIGYHSHSHKIIYNRQILEEEMVKSREFLRAFKPIGFRAPQIYITNDSFSCLKKYGFKYSSSTYSNYKIEKIDEIYEIPVSAYCYREVCNNSKKLPKNLTFRGLCSEIPFGSGLFISLFGIRISHFIKKLNKKGIPAIIFFHPWQLIKHRKIDGLGFKLEVIRKNPFCFPYTMNINQTIEGLLKRNSFTTFRTFYGY